MLNDCNVLLGYGEPLRVCEEKRKDTFKTREIIQVLNETTKKGAALSTLKSKLKNRHT